MNDNQFDQVVDHVLAELNSGVSEQAIRQEMHDKGYPAHFTEQVFEEIHVTMHVPTVEPSKETVTDGLIDAATHIVSQSPRVQGRIGRLGFLTTLLALYVSLAIPALTFIFMFRVIDRAAWSGFFGIVMLILIPLFFALYLWTVWLRLTICARRLHDMGHSGTAAVLSFVGLFDLLLYVILLTTPGKSEANQYGEPNPETNPLHILHFTK